jgi:hypothetical protein
MQFELHLEQMEVAENAQLPMIYDVRELVLQPIAMLLPMSSSNVQFEDGGVAVATAGVAAMLLRDNGTPGGRFLGQLDCSKPGANTSVCLIALIGTRVLYATGSWLGTVAFQALQSKLVCQPHLGEIMHLLAGQRYDERESSFRSIACSIALV